eukprot:COSAG01_NODE_11769_length_1862_cov_2.245604_2_plen_291_part_00
MNCPNCRARFQRSMRWRRQQEQPQEEGKREPKGARGSESETTSWISDSSMGPMVALNSRLGRKATDADETAKLLARALEAAAEEGQGQDGAGGDEGHQDVSYWWGLGVIMMMPMWPWAYVVGRKQRVSAARVEAWGQVSEFALGGLLPTERHRATYRPPQCTHARMHWPCCVCVCAGAWRPADCRSAAHAQPHCADRVCRHSLWRCVDMSIDRHHHHRTIGARSMGARWTAPSRSVPSEESGRASCARHTGEPTRPGQGQGQAAAAATARRRARRRGPGGSARQPGARPR